MRISFLVALAFLSFFGFAQVELQWNWVQSAIGKDGHTTINDTYADASGNMYITGKFGSETLFFDGDSVSNINRESELTICIGFCDVSYTKNAFIAKLNNEGNVEWLQSIEGRESEEGIAITVNSVGEVWVLANSNSDSAIVDINVLELNKENVWSNSSFILKLNSDGSYGNMYQLVGDDSYLKKAWINIVGDKLNIVGTFDKGGDNFVDVVGQRIESKGRSGSPLSLLVKAETGIYEDFFYLGEPTVASNYSSVLDVEFKEDQSIIYASITGNEIKYNNQVISLTGEENLKYYIAGFNNSGSRLNFFQHQSEFEGKITTNDSLVVVLTEESFYNDPSTVFELEYFTFNGEKIKEYTENLPNTAAHNFYIYDIELDESLNVVMASSFRKTLTIGSETFIAKEFHHSGKEGTTTQFFTDILLLVVNYNTGLSFTDHIIGETLNETPISLTSYGNKIRFIASVQSAVVNMGNNELINNNETNFMYDHGSLIGMYRYENIVFTEFEVLKDVTGTNELFNNQLLIYPNPSSGLVKIETLSNADKIEVYSVAGQLLDVYKDSVVEEVYYSKGTYIIRAIAGDKVLTQKLIVR